MYKLVFTRHFLLERKRSPYVPYGFRQVKHHGIQIHYKIQKVSPNEGRYKPPLDNVRHFVTYQYIRLFFLFSIFKNPFHVPKQKFPTFSMKVKFCCILVIVSIVFMQIVASTVFSEYTLDSSTLRPSATYSGSFLCGFCGCKIIYSKITSHQIPSRIVSQPLIANHDLI